MKKKILVTAFEPFAGRRRNPALDVLLELPPALGGHSLHKFKLPVDGNAVGRRIAELIRRVKPDLIVSLGLAAGEAGIRVERFALNIKDYGIKDNAGRRPEGKKIKEGGPAAYSVSSDPVKLVAAIRKAGVPAYVSNHAGAYVCNTLMYEALHAAGPGVKYAFIHLPLTTEMVLADEPGKALAPSLPLSLLVKAVEAAIKVI